MLADNIKAGVGGHAIASRSLRSGSDEELVRLRSALVNNKRIGENQSLNIHLPSLEHSSEYSKV